jgi:hypothetical protein
MISRHRVVMLLALCAATAPAAVGLVTCGTVPAYAQPAGPWSHPATGGASAMAWCTRPARSSAADSYCSTARMPAAASSDRGDPRGPRGPRAGPSAARAPRVDDSVVYISTGGNLVALARALPSAVGGTVAAWTSMCRDDRSDAKLTSMLGFRQGTVLWFGGVALNGGDLGKP